MTAAGRPRPASVLLPVAALMAAAFSAFVALGVWQLERRAWKLDLIARVDARIHAAPAAAPGPGAWLDITADDAEYRRIRLAGAFDHGRETLVQAVTELGPGFWVMTPFRGPGGVSTLVNRGFVPPEKRDPAIRAQGLVAGETTVTGLLRFTEPRGGFLRANDPDADVWRSRDVAAITAKRRLTDAAPYFVDADATPNRGGWPVGGLTVVAFRNEHLVYALTWFGLALMTLVGAAVVIRHERRARRIPRA